MRLFITFATVGCLGVLIPLAASVPSRRQSSPTNAPAADATARIVAASQAFLATLDAAGKSKVQLAYDAPEKKTGWSNLPIGMVPRNGIRMGDLTPAQRAAAMAVLAAAFSQDGCRKVTETVLGDEMLRTNASGRGPGGPGGGRIQFGQDEYYLAFLGTPSTAAPWMLQFGGHHLAINLTLAGPRATLAPSLTGAQPARFTFEGRTIRPLGKENDKAFALMAALDATQRSQAILGSTVSDLVLGPGHDGRSIQPEGLRASAMSAPQQAMLLDLAREWAGIANDALAAPRLEEIKTNLPQTWFAWSGPTTEGSLAYFRIQGPTLVIEYAPQRSVDHIHTIYRDPTNDYGSAYAGK
jgi:Protein of unknown function (DUF3500)